MRLLAASFGHAIVLTYCHFERETIGSLLKAVRSKEYKSSGTKSVGEDDVKVAF